MLSGAGVRVELGQRLLETSGAVTKAGTRLTALTMASGERYTGQVFVDATYEGDLIARAGASYRVGREGTAEFGESIAGVRPALAIMTVPRTLDPGVPLAAPPGPVGSADTRIQASNYRVCLTRDPSNRVAFPRPPAYDADRYELVLEYIRQRSMQTGQPPSMDWLLHMDPLVGGKYDLNEHGAVSFGLPGANYGYPDGTDAERSAIAAEHRDYQQGYLYFLAGDGRVPPEIRDEIREFGLCGDEFTDNGNWPRLLYLREGRRMVGEYVVSRRDLVQLVSKPDAIGLASYRCDCDGRLLVEGTLGSSTQRRWSIPYRSLTPLRGEATNLLVPVNASMTHVAYASYRMEPQYLIAGQAAGTAAAMAATTGVAVQDVDIDALQARLAAAGAVLDDPGDIADRFYEAFEWAYLEGITAGCAPGLFCPDAPLPRDQAAALLSRTLDLPTTSLDLFADDDGLTLEEHINRVAAAGITFGCQPAAFCPTRVVTRAEIAGMLSRAFRLPPTDVDYFTDDDGLTLEDHINRVATAGITLGCRWKAFCPARAVSRGEAIAMLFRHYDGGASGGWSPAEPGTDSAATSPTPTATPTPTPTPTPTATPTVEPSASASPAPTPTPTAEPSPTPSASGAPSPEPTPAAPSTGPDPP
jgi:hypothetical protein